MVVNFENALALYNSGFPQPEIQEGQYWYIFGEKTIVIPKQDHERAIYFNAEHVLDDLVGVFEVGDSLPIGRSVFAPTVEDLYPLLPISCRLIPVLGWKVKCQHTGIVFSGETGADACAIAYLHFFSIS